jgi:pyruvate dehydrogenase E2 component (dihydrolipoamide acetyltransferase)
MLARESSIALVDVQGTGPRGRILAADVAEFVPSAAAPAVATEASAAAPAAAASVAGVDFTDLPLDQAKQARALEFVSSKQNIPHYYLTIDMEVDSLLNIRADLNENLADDDAISTNDFFIKASALAMKKVPDVNASWMDTFVRQYNSVNTSITVGDGLYLPVVAGADTTGLFGISQSVKELVAKVEDGSIASEDVQGGTFSMTNLGMFGVKTASAVINSPQAAHLTIGTIEKRILPNDDPDSEEIYREAYMVTATLSLDHRVIDGAVGATWLQAFKNLVEDPVTMLL